MTMPSIERYRGREQAYVKHYFLASYLERLVHKVASRYDQIVYIDGFSGPWQSESEEYDDTSLGIALRALRSAKASWGAQGRDVAMKAVLVEKSSKPHAALTSLQPLYPDVVIHPIQGNFCLLISQILSAVPQGAFAFVLIDPKGWRIPIDQIASLLKRPNTEVVFNFMFDFINRAASMSNPAIGQGLNELLPTDDWRDELAAVVANFTEEEGPAARRRVLLDAFRQVLGEKGGYRYVAETPIFRPHLERVSS